MVYFHVRPRKANIQPEPQDPGAAVLSDAKPPNSDLANVNGKETVASPVESPINANVTDRSGRSTSRPQLPAVVTVQGPGPGSSSDFQSLLQAFSDSVIETAVHQSRYETLKRDEKQQLLEQTRWSRYYDHFTSIGEDQSRNFKATQKAAEQSQQQLDQAKQKSEQAMRKAAQSLVTASASKSAPTTDTDNPTMKRLERRVLVLSDENDFLRKEIVSLRQSVVEAKSGHHHLNEIAGTQKRHEQELSELQKSTLRKSTYRELEAKIDKKISDLTTQSKALTDFSSKQDHINKDIADFQARKVESIRSELQSEFKKFKDDVHKNSRNDEITSATLKRLQEGSAALRQETLPLQESKARTEDTLKDLSERLHKTDRNVLTIRERSEQILETYTKDNQGLRDELEALRKKLQDDSVASRQDVLLLQESKAQTEETLKDLSEGLHKTDKNTHTIHERSQQVLTKCTKDSQGLRDELEALRNKVQESLAASRQDTLLLQESKALTEDTLKDLGDRLREMEQNTLTIRERSHQIMEPLNKASQQLRHALEVTGTQFDIAAHIKDNHQIREEQQALNVRLDSIEQTLEEYRRPQAHTLNELTNAQSGMRQSINGLGQGMEERLEELSQTVYTMKEIEEQRDEAVSQEIDGFNDLLNKANQKIEDQGTVLVSYQSQLDNQQNRIDRLSADQSSNIADVKACIDAMQRAIDTAKHERTAQQPLLDKLQSDVSFLQRQVDSISQKSIQPSPPPSVCSTKDEVQPKIEALETNVQDLQNSKDGMTDKLKAIESFQAAQESRWNNLTTEPIVNSVVQYVQRMYPLPVFQVDLGQVKQRQHQLDLRIVQLNEFVNKTHEGDAQELREIGKIARETRKNREGDVEKINEVGRAAREATDLSRNTQKIVQEVEARFTPVHQFVGKMSLELEEVKRQNRAPPQTQESPTILEIKLKLESLETKYDTATSAIQESKSKVHRIEANMNGELLGLKAQLDTFRGEFKESWEQSKEELVKLDAKVMKLDAQDTVNDDSQGVVVDSQDHTAKPADDNSDSDAPIVRRSKRSQPTQDSEDINPKKRKITRHPSASDEDPSVEEKVPSISPQSTRKSGRNVSQQLVDSPSSQSRRGRPRKTAD
ncbi:MAG: hypothetical protein Q9225_004670 [Loekoesia sp. 1 TL-2023]